MTVLKWLKEWEEEQKKEEKSQGVNEISSEDNPLFDFERKYTAWF